jgi:Spy/CpxP family protein refolding chaperone
MSGLRPFFLIFFWWIIFSTSALGQGAGEGKGPEGPWEKGPELRGRRGMMDPRHGPMMGEWAERLHLTVEQTARLQKLRESFLKETLSLRNDLVIKRFDLHDLLADPQSDPRRVLAKQTEISELESKIGERMVIYRLEMRQILTPEQVKLLPDGIFFRGFHGRRMMPGQGRGMGRE